MLMKVFAKPYTASSLIVMARKQRTKSRDFFNFLLRQASQRAERRKSKLLLFALLAAFVGGE